MRTVILDGTVICDREGLHDALKARLELPEWYGRNLDALYDCLTDMRDGVEIQLINRRELDKNLGAYAGRLEQVLRMAAQENKGLSVVFLE